MQDVFCLVAKTSQKRRTDLNGATHEGTYKTSRYINRGLADMLRVLQSCVVIF